MKTEWVQIGGYLPVVPVAVDYEPWDIKVDSQGNVFAAGLETIQNDNSQTVGFLMLDSQGNWQDYDLVSNRLLKNSFFKNPQKSLSIRLERCYS